MRVLLALLAVLPILGCRGPRLTSTPVAVPPEPYRAVLGHTAEGRPFEVVVLGRGTDITLVIATIHGDEPGGTHLVHRFVEHLQGTPVLLEGRRVVLVPVANPDGRAAHTRQNADGVDLNRGFPARNRRERPFATPPEARLLKALVTIYHPARILSIHAPLACVDYDGPAQGLAERIAAASELPVQQLGARPGSLGSWAGVDLGLPVVTLELPADTNRMNADRLWQRYGDAMVAALGP